MNASIGNDRAMVMTYDQMQKGSDVNSELTYLEGRKVHVAHHVLSTSVISLDAGHQGDDDSTIGVSDGDGGDGGCSTVARIKGASSPST